MSQKPRGFAHAAFDSTDILTKKPQTNKYLPFYYVFGSVALLLLRTDSMTEIRTAI